MTFLSLNHISLFGRVASTPTVTPIGRVRAITLGVETDDEGGARVHRVVIQDEFLAKAMQDRLVEGAAVQVLGELDYDDVGAFVSITQRRGSDVHVLAGEAPAPVQAGRAPVTPVRSTPASVPSSPAREPPAEAQAAPPPAASSSAAPAPVRTPPPVQAAQPPRPAPSPSPAATGAVAAPPRRPPFPPSAPSMPAPPRPAPPGRPAGGALSGLQSGARTTQVEDPFPGDTSPAATSAPKPNGGGRAHTGPDSLDDDIPF